MSVRHLLGLGVALGLLSLVHSTGPASAMKIQQVKSPGGISAWLVQEHSVPLLALRYAFEGGGAQESADKSGLASFMTSMLDEGAGDLDARTFQERMEELAFKMSFDESRDAFYGSFETLTANRDASVAMLALAITKPRFDADAVERIRGQILAGIARNAKNPTYVAGREWISLAFPGHPYGRVSGGTVETIRSITRDDLEAYRRRIFAKDTLKVVAVGDIDAQALGTLLDTVFGSLPEKATLVPVATIEPPAKGVVQVVEIDVPQSVVQFGSAGIARKDKDYIAAFVMNQVLGGGGFSSRLTEQVREKRGLAYSVYSYIQPFKHTSIFGGSVATKNEEVAQSLDVIRSELRRMAEGGLTAKELEDAKSYLIGSYPLRFDTNAKIANQLLAIMVEDLGIDYVDKRNGEIEAVTLDDVKRAAQRVLKADDLIVTVVGKPKGLVGSGPATAPAAPADKPPAPSAPKG